MFVVLCMIATIWGIGAAMGAPRRQRWIMVGGILAGVIVIQLALPVENGLRQATGGSVKLWLLILGFGLIIWAYRFGLRKLREKAGKSYTPLPQKDTLSEAELTRYSRHIVLREIGGVGQKRLDQAKVLVIGAGGLGSPALQYLAAAGVGTIGIVDDDTVEVSNLQRQVIHGDQDVGEMKVISATESLHAINPHLRYRAYGSRFDAENAADLIDEYDLVLDGCDNFATRYLANEVAVSAGKPLISGALSQWDGQVSVFYPAKSGPCYACLFPQSPDTGLAPSCAEAGVFAPLPGVIGTLMASEAVKWITGAGTPLLGRMVIYDGLDCEFRTLKTKPNLDCPVCQTKPTPKGPLK